MSLSSFLYFSSYLARLVPPSFPTRRSSDLFVAPQALRSRIHADHRGKRECSVLRAGAARPRNSAARKCLDRKSTRLNSSHVAISYAVFCLKKTTKKLDDPGYYEVQGVSVYK